jgi:hypothetical protein
MRALRLAGVALASIALGGTASGCTPRVADNPSIDPATLRRLGSVDQRYQSYNIEMLEVTGGYFWKPYGAADAPTSTGAAPSVPAGMNPNIYQYRGPLELGNPRLRAMAAALGPAYVRVSGTWANTTFFADTDTPPAAPPPGFNGVLSRQQWRAVVDFSHAVDANIVSSFATSPGVRDARGVWTSDLARRWLEYTRSVGGRIAAAEFMNEPTMAVMGGAPAGYDAAAYGRDFKAFKAFATQAAPDTTILGPGSVGETPGPWSMTYGTAGTITTADMSAAAGPGIDAFSYHHYGAASLRCAAMGMPQTTEIRCLVGGLVGPHQPDARLLRRAA